MWLQSDSFNSMCTNSIGRHIEKAPVMLYFRADTPYKIQGRQMPPIYGKKFLLTRKGNRAYETQILSM